MDSGVGGLRDLCFWEGLVGGSDLIEINWK